MDRKKELKEKYKTMKPEMGVFRIASTLSGNGHLYATQDLKSLMNRFRFQLAMGSHPDRALQNEWNEQGPDNFIIEILERLEYDKDESKTDYGEDLELLRLLCEERLEASRNDPATTIQQQVGRSARVDTRGPRQDAA